MIGYDEFTQYAPPVPESREAHDQWFTDHGYNIRELLQAGREVAEFRLSRLADGDQLGSDQLTVLLLEAFLFGFELAVRVERDEKPDLTLPEPT